MIKKHSVLMLAFFVLLVSGCAFHEEHTLIERRHYGDHELAIGYTQAVRTGNLLYLSGLTHPGDSMANQLTGIYNSIERILADYNATSADIVKEVIYATHIDELIDAIPVRKAYFPDDLYPASSWVQVERLFLPEFKVEVEVIVKLSGRK